MSVLSTKIPVSISILEVLVGVALLLALFVALGYFVSFWNNIRKKHPELPVFRIARKFPFPPIIALVDGAGKIMFFNGLKKKKSDVQFNKDDYGLLIDPAILTKKPRSSLADGTPVYFYGTDTYFPTDPLAIRSIMQLINYMRNEFKIFEYINEDIILMELLLKEGDDLLKDCETVIKRIELDKIVTVEQDGVEVERQIVEPEELAYAIEVSKMELKTEKISNGYFSFNDGLSRLPLGTVAGDFKRAIQLAETAAKAENTKDPLIIAAIAFAVIVGVILLAYMVTK